MATARFNIHYRTNYGQNLKVVGSLVQLGKNDWQKAPYMFHDGNGFWRLDIDLPASVKSFTYRYIVVNDHDNSYFGELFHSDRTGVLKSGTGLQVFDDVWRPPFKAVGVAIPVFSIRTKQGMGIGEFADIKQMADWAAQCNLKVIQILPIYDTTVNFTHKDACPYAAISTFALHPIYLNIAALGNFTPKEKTTYNALCKRLNALQDIDYDTVIVEKWNYIRLFFKRNGAATLDSTAFKDFYANNKSWLDAYSVFCALRDHYKTVDYNQWETLATYSKTKATAYMQAHSEDVHIHLYVQYHLHCQLSDAKQHAQNQGVSIKGDLPIGVFRHSVETWTAPDLFNMDAQAGAPPDAFSTTGQNWSFPTYNWDAMERTNYKWWKLRLKTMENYFQLLRIDHILGFFRIWQIPMGCTRGLLGHFSPALPFTPDELRNRGLIFNINRFCKPYIPEKLLLNLFGNHTAFVKSAFLQPIQDTFYEFKPKYATQKAIEKAFTSTQLMPLKNILKDTLLSLLEEVLFIEDEQQKGCFHPRISMQFTRSFKDLDSHTANMLNRIYDDYFYCRHNEFWKIGALKKLSTIKTASHVVLCGEDLGMVPITVPEVMNELQILSLVIQRMPNKQTSHFADLCSAPYLSVCSPGSHDMSTIRGWWEEDEATRQRFYQDELHASGDAPAVCTPDIVEQIIKQHLRAPSIWAIFPIQDLLGTSTTLRSKTPQNERINNPANPNHYWRYRLHLNVEQLLNETDFNNYLKTLIADSNRN